jgi:hypothetical protein
MALQPRRPTLTDSIKFCSADSAMKVGRSRTREIEKLEGE